MEKRRRRREDEQPEGGLLTPDVISARMAVSPAPDVNPGQAAVLPASDVNPGQAAVPPAPGVNPGKAAVPPAPGVNPGQAAVPPNSGVNPGRAAVPPAAAANPGRTEVTPIFQPVYEVPYPSPFRDEYETEEPKYLGGWAYVFWTIVFTLPVIGLLFVLIFSFVGDNVNRKKFARSFLCWLLIGVVILIILLIGLYVVLANANIDPNLIAVIRAIMHAFPEMIRTIKDSISTMSV